MLSLDDVHGEQRSAGTCTNPLHARAAEDHDNLEKTVNALAKRVDAINDSVVKLNKETPRGSVGGEGVAQLMANVKRDQESERVVVEALLQRISSLCDKVNSVERRMLEAAQDGGSSLQHAATESCDLAAIEARLQDLSATVASRAELRSSMSGFVARLESLEIDTCTRLAAESLERHYSQSDGSVENKVSTDLDDQVRKLAISTAKIDKLQESFGGFSSRLAALEAMAEKLQDSSSHAFASFDVQTAAADFQSARAGVAERPKSIQRKTTKELLESESSAVSECTTGTVLAQALERHDSVHDFLGPDLTLLSDDEE